MYTPVPSNIVVEMPGCTGYQVDFPDHVPLYPGETVYYLTLLRHVNLWAQPFQLETTLETDCPTLSVGIRHCG